MEANTPFSDLSAQLIDENYRQIGCDSWSRDRFFRLCGKLNRTEREMAALLRIAPAKLRGRLADGFTPQDGLILTMLDQEIDFVLSGHQPTRGIFLFAELKEAR